MDEIGTWDKAVAGGQSKGELRSVLLSSAELCPVKRVNVWTI